MSKEFWSMVFLDGSNFFDGMGYADVVIDDKVVADLKTNGKPDDEIEVIKQKAIESWYEWRGNPDNDILVSVKPYSDAKAKAKETK